MLFHVLAIQGGDDVEMIAGQDFLTEGDAYTAAQDTMAHGLHLKHGLRSRVNYARVIDDAGAIYAELYDEAD